MGELILMKYLKYTMNVCLLFTACVTLLFPSLAQAGTVTVYPVQAGLVDDGSCCNPYTYTNSGAATFVLTGCFDSYYGCGYDVERAVWRWDLEDEVPDGAEVTSAYIRWDQSSSCWANQVDVWIDANTQLLSSSYCAQMRSGSDQVYYNQSYSGSAASWVVNPQVIEQALAGGYLSLQTDNGTGADGCAIYSTGPQGIRVVINYDYPETVGACCMNLGQCLGGLSEIECSDSGGSWQGGDSECDLVTCQKVEYVEIRHSIVGSSTLASGETCWTVDLFAAVEEGGRVDAVAGNTIQQKLLSSTYGFYQDPYGGPTSKDVNPAFYPFAPDLHLDTRVTIGALDMTGDPFDGNNLGSVGIDWEVFESGGDLSVGNGTWYVLPADEQGSAQPFVAQDCSQHHGVRLARLTAIDLNSTIMFEALVQGRDADQTPWQDLIDYSMSYEEVVDCNGNNISDTCDIANGESQDVDGNGVPDECESICDGDVDGDGDADVNDALAIIGAWGQVGPNEADLNGDELVNVNDLLQMLDWYGNC